MIRSIHKRQIGMLCALLFLGTLALYWPARHFDFVQYDDNDYVFDNPTVRAGLSGWGVVWSIVDAHALNWHPVTWLSHMLDCQLFGLNAGPHHLINVVFHCFNTVLLFWVLQQMTGSVWRSAFVAALFAWHPLRVESVAWISERKDVLSGFFFMLTLWAYTRYVQGKQEARSAEGFSLGKVLRSRFYLWSLIFFTLGLLSKPMLVTTPFLLLLLDYWPLNRIDFAALRARETPGLSKRLWLEKLPFFFLAFVLSVVTYFAQKSGGAIEPVGISLRLENMVVGYFGYLEKSFWPAHLTFLYFRPQNIPLTQVLVAAAVLVTISIIAGINLRRRPYVTIGWLWFCGMLVPVSGIIPVGLQSIADRYTYLPSIGLLLILTWSAAELISAWLSRRTAPIALGFAAALVLVACIITTRHQLMYWRDTATLMEHALELNPNNYIAHSNLGVHLSKSGKTAEALLHYQRARELTPPTSRAAFKFRQNPPEQNQSHTNSPPP